jgi:uncharacterized protein (DUF2141 family)
MNKTWAMSGAWASVLALGAMAAAFPAKAEPQPVVTVIVANVRAPQGAIYAALHDERGWRESVTRVRVPVAGSEVSLQLTAPRPGRYAVRLFQDVDGDGEMATGMLGMPAEPFGFSNDAPLQFGPPSFEDAAFEVGADGAATTVTLR